MKNYVKPLLEEENIDLENVCVDASNQVSSTAVESAGIGDVKTGSAGSLW